MAEILVNGTFTGSISPWTQEDLSGGSAWTWTSDRVEVTPYPVGTDYIKQSFANVKYPGDYDYALNFLATLFEFAGPGTYDSGTITVRLYRLGVFTESFAIGTWQSDAAADSSSGTFTATLPFDEVKIYLTFAFGSPGGSYVFALYDVSLQGESLLITQRPASFCPVNNPVVYKFHVLESLPLHRLAVGVYLADDDSLIGSMTSSPDLSGNILADVSFILKNILYRDWEESTDTEDNIGSARFYIKYQELYTGSATSEVDDVANPRRAVLSALQIGNNADLDEYVLEDNTKKFLTKFDTPSMWRGYPFSISMLAQSSLTSPSSVIVQYNSAGGTISTTTTAVPWSVDDSLVRIFISSVDSNCVRLTIKITDSGDISETKTITVKDPCDNPIYLFWKNSLGGDAFWMFDHSQDYSWIIEDNKKANQQLLFAENITINEFDAINEVNTVGTVYQSAIPELTTSINKTSARTDQQLYVIDEDGNKTGVINITRNQTTRTRQVKHFVDVLIEYPEQFL